MTLAASVFATKMRAYYATTLEARKSILASGFRDAGSYASTREYRGVWVSDRALEQDEGAARASYVVVDIPEEVFQQYEWVEQSAPGYREALIPASILNCYQRLAWDEE